jgi:hypothetical protein
MPISQCPLPLAGSPASSFIPYNMEMTINRPWKRWFRVLAHLSLLLSTSAALADGPLPPTGAAVWEVFPPAEFYPYSIADPIRPQAAVMVLFVTDTDIPATGDRRFGLRLGGRFPIVRVHPEGEPDRGWQLDFNGGFIAEFDMEHSLDNIGWDGLYGLLLTYKPSSKFALRLGTRHDSAHLGDEYMERTGRTRIGYTREELVAGVSWMPEPRWHLYAEGGDSYAVKPFQKRLRMQAGVEYLGTTKWRNGKTGWYAALDLRGYAENDWSPRLTMQIGLLLPTGFGTNRYRFALEIGTGRSILGEFFTSKETYAAIGWFFDY